MADDTDATINPGEGEETLSMPANGNDLAPEGDKSVGLAQDGPTWIGRYRILGKLGEGGMGVVYEAQQQNPKRRVAVKVVRGGQFVDAARVRMFQREADTLARLEHSDIGGIYESGCTDDGQHFFAMELVQGVTLDVFLQSRAPTNSTEELRFRLQMFRKIANAVHYAHQRGVIHRDLKPSNVVVTEGPEIKILDFGLARITEGDITAATMTTEVGVIKGTLPYMSPEQARGNPQEIDVRTDVYALGVILYEMLSGRRPYDVAGRSLPEAIRAICEQEPTSLRQTMSGTKRLDQDIETIVGKALEKDTDRRYASAKALSQDIDRWLTSQPILARPPSTMYQVRKFANRNRALVGGVAATFLVLVAGVIMSTVLGLREASQRRMAEETRDNLEVIADFQAEMLSSIDPREMGARLADDLKERFSRATQSRNLTDAEAAELIDSYDASMAKVSTTDIALAVIDRNILASAVEALDEQFGDKPLLDAQLRRTIGETYRKLGLFEQAEPQVLAALSVRRRELGDRHPDTLDAVNLLGALYFQQGRLDEAEPLYIETLEARREIIGPEHPDTLDSLSNLAVLHLQHRQLDEAEALMRETLEMRTRVLGANAPETLSSMHNLATVLVRLDRMDEAEALMLETLAKRRSALGNDHQDTVRSIRRIAAVYYDQRRFEEAEPLFAESLEIGRRVLGSDHTWTLWTMHFLGRVHYVQRNYEKAEPLFLEALDTKRRILGDDDPDTLESMNHLANLYGATNRLKEAEDLHRATFEARERVLGEDHLATIGSMNSLVNLLATQGRHEEARPLVVRLLSKQRMAAEAPDASAGAKNTYAWSLLTIEPADLQKPDEALRFALEANELSGYRVASRLDTLALAYSRAGQPEKAVETQELAVSLLPVGDQRSEFESRLEDYKSVLNRPR